MPRLIVFFWIVLFWCGSPEMVHAYIGPGLGLGAIGAVLGVVFSIFLALFAVFWYPIKRLIKKIKNQKSNPM